MNNLSASSLALAIDATHLPSQPRGSASLKMTDVVNGEMQLGEIDLGAKNRADGKIAVNLTSRPKQDPWLIELAALVTPPGKGDTTTIDLTHHHVRAGNGAEWTGNTGHFVMDPHHFAITNLDSTSRDGHISVDATVERGGYGDLTAKLDLDKFKLDAIGQRYRGSVDVHANIARKANRYSGTRRHRRHGLVARSDEGDDRSAPPRSSRSPARSRSTARPRARTSARRRSRSTSRHLRDVTDALAWKHAGPRGDQAGDDHARGRRPRGRSRA